MPERPLDPMTAPEVCLTIEVLRRERAFVTAHSRSARRQPA